MNGIKNLNDKTELKILRNRIDGSLALIRGELGLNVLRTAGIRYEADGASCKITVVAEVTVNGKDKDTLAFERYHILYDGLKPEHLHSTFGHRGAWYEVVGIAPTRSKFPIIARMVGTKRTFFFPVTIIPRLKVKEVAA